MFQYFRDFFNTFQTCDGLIVTRYDGRGQYFWSARINRGVLRKVKSQIEEQVQGVVFNARFGGIYVVGDELINEVYEAMMGVGYSMCNVTTIGFMIDS